MINSVSVTNHLGQSLSMNLRNPELSGFLIHGIDGLGPEKVSINVLKTAQTPGGIFTGIDVPTKNIVLGILFHDVRESVETLRHKSYAYFPVGEEITLYFETELNLLKIHGVVESNSPSIFSNKSGCIVSVICEIPYFSSSNGGVETLFSGLSGGFEFPFSNESLTENLLQFSEIESKNTKNVFYEGDVRNGVIITVDFIGSVSGFQIANLTTQQLFSINDTRLAAIAPSGFSLGDRLIMDSRMREKTLKLIRNGITLNVLNARLRESTWIELEKGDNVFYYAATSGLENIYLSVNHEVLYKGA